MISFSIDHIIKLIVIICMLKDILNCLFAFWQNGTFFIQPFWVCIYHLRKFLYNIVESIVISACEICRFSNFFIEHSESKKTITVIINSLELGIKLNQLISCFLQFNQYLKSVTISASEFWTAISKAFFPSPFWIWWFARCFNSKHT